MRSTTYHFTIGTSSTLILGPNPKRTSLVLNGDNTNTITVGFDGNQVANQGLTVSQYQPTIAVDRIDVGEQIANPVYAVASAAGAKLTVIEGFV